MVDLVKPTICDDKEDVILNMGKNDPCSKKTVSQIARYITEQAILLKGYDNLVIISGISQSHYYLNNKANQVKNCLLQMCKEPNISFISHSESTESSKLLNEWW